MRNQDIASVLAWPGMRSEHSRFGPHEGLVETMPGQIGVVLTGHRNLAYSADGHTRDADIAPGAATITADAPVGWLRVSEATEAVEIYPDPHFLHAIAVQHGLSGVGLRPAVGEMDGIVLAVALRLRQVHVMGAALSDVAASELAHLISRHLLVRYAGADPRAFRVPGRLSGSRVDQVAQYVDAHLGSSLSLTSLAALTQLSPFHFARMFRAATGMAPHAFVTARRMMRARIILEQTSATVEETAEFVSYQNVGHFRRAFVSTHGFRPSEIRGENRKNGPVGTRSNL